MAKLNDDLRRVVQSLEEVLTCVESEEVDTLIEKLIQIRRDNKKVYITAAGRSLLIMRTFAMRLMQIGLRAYVVFDTNTPAIGEGDLLIVGSGSGKTETVQVIAKEAIKFGAQVALFTKNSQSPLAKLSDYIVQIPTDKASEKLQTNGSVFEQSLFILCDVIGVSLIEKEKLIKDINEIDKFIYKLHANLQ